MPNITVTNLYSGPYVVPKGYYVGAIQPNASVTFHVDDSDEFIGDARVAADITAGRIRVDHSAADAITRPFSTYTTATLPDPTTVPAGTVVWNTTTRAFEESDGTAWAPLVEGGSVLLTAAATAIAAYRFVGLDTSGLVAVSPTATERWLGVTTEAIGVSGTGRVQTGGPADVMASGAITANDEVICAPGGFAAPYQSAAISLGTAVAGADASDDIDQTNLPDAVDVICAADETGNTVIVYGQVGASYDTETITLGAAGTYTGTKTFAAIFCLETTATSVGTIDIQDATNTGNLIPQIAGTTGARKYGAIVPDVSTDPEGQHVQIRAGGANASDVVLFGTDAAGTEQAEIVTMNGTTWVEGTLAFRALTHVFIGADGIVWNAGVTSQYDQQVEANERNEIRGYAVENIAAGAAGAVLLLPQNMGLPVGESPILFHSSQVSYGGGGTSTTATVYDVAATDVIQATLNAATNAVYVTRAERTAADTITITFSADPGASTLVGLTVIRP